MRIASEDATLAWDGSVTTLEPMAAASHTLRPPRALSLNSTSRPMVATLHLPSDNRIRLLSTSPKQASSI